MAKKKPNLTPKNKSSPGDGDWQEPFLRAFRNCGIVRLACKKAGVSRASMYAWMANHSDFAERFKEAREDACDALEKVAVQRAKESSDTLLIFLLKANRPKKYREQYQLHHRGKIRHETTAEQRRLEFIALLGSLGTGEGTGPEDAGGDVASPAG